MASAESSVPSTVTITKGRWMGKLPSATVASLGATPSTATAVTVSFTAERDA